MNQSSYATVLVRAIGLSAMVFQAFFLRDYKLSLDLRLFKLRLLISTVKNF